MKARHTFSVSMALSMSVSEFEPFSIQFRNSACPTKFSYVFYDNEAIDRDQNWIRDKGVTLYYNSDDSLDFLLNG